MLYLYMHSLFESRYLVYKSIDVNAIEKTANYRKYNIQKIIVTFKAIKKACPPMRKAFILL